MRVSTNITLIIPTYNRPDLLKRAISYWSAYGHQLIIVDGSDVPNEECTKYDTEDGITYFHMPVSIEQRILFAASQVATDYVAMIPDDEFYLPSALEEARDILDSMPDVSFVAGATIAFKTIDGRLFSRHHYRTAMKLQIDSNSPLERVKQ
ncbi:MAG: TIGR00180 family glycosyltransferase, partial [Sterolibacterium sp.]